MGRGLGGGAGRVGCRGRPKQERVIEEVEKVSDEINNVGESRRKREGLEELEKKG